ncbi:MAG: transposase [Deltaproteobacteria bacterium]
MRLSSGSARRSSHAPRTPIDAAFGYASNLQGALRQFLDDGRLPIHNNASEAALRNLVLGRSNWMWFENETGLSWYRSLIASCALHGINAGTYLEQLLRIAPHWPSTRMLELSPKYWARTLAGLDERHRRIITPPWELDPASLAVEWKPRRRATATAA